MRLLPYIHASLVLLLAGFALPLRAQDQIWGLTRSYNINLEGGTVFRLGSDGQGFSTVYQFPVGLSGTKDGSYFQGSDGKIYCFTTGFLGIGSAAFRMNLDGSQPEKLFSFIPASSMIGIYPSDMIEGSDGRLYVSVNGNTEGTFSGGSVFSTKRDGTDLRILYSYEDHANDPLPVLLGFSRITEGPDGLLYGIARQIEGTGFPVLLGSSIVRMAKDGSARTILKTFPFADGIWPVSLTFGPNQQLYGITDASNPSEEGVFRMNADGSNYTLLQAFPNTIDPTDAENPASQLLAHTDGRLYGIALSGGAFQQGALYSVGSSGGFVLEHSFSTPYPIFDTGNRLRSGSDGYVYGAASSDGTEFSGQIFRFLPGGSFQVLHSYVYAQREAEGRYPAGSPILAGGQLYGFASADGPGGSGVWYRMQPDGTQYNPFHPTPGIPLGSDPRGALLRSENGDWYGVNYTGFYSLGGFGVSPGCIFRLDPDGSNARAVAGFDIPEGVYPGAGLSAGNDGYLYGVTEGGGINDNGTIFRVKPDGSSYQTLHVLTSAEGSYPSIRLLRLPDGRMAGATRSGGSGGQGVLYRIDADGSNFTVLREFSTSSAYTPSGALIYGQDGMLYGVLQDGGAGGRGAVYRISPDGSGFSLILEFDDVTGGGRPAGALFQDTDGTLYGAAQEGNGFSSCGGIFKISPNGQNFSFIANFDNFSFPLCKPQGDLKKGSDGFLYGSAESGSTLQIAGGVFKVRPSGQDLTALHSFDFSDGYWPGELALVPGTTGISGELPEGMSLTFANPAARPYARLDLRSSRAHALQVSLLDLTGRVCYAEDGLQLAPGAAQQLLLPTGGLPAGLYVLTISDGVSFRYARRVLLAAGE